MAVSAPPFGAPTPSENSTEPSSNHGESSYACGSRTGVTRAREPASTSDSAALEGPRTAAVREEGSAGPGGTPAFDEKALLERVAARERDRAPVIDVDRCPGDPARRRSGSVASWPRLAGGSPARSVGGGPPRRALGGGVRRRGRRSPGRRGPGAPRARRGALEALPVLAVQGTGARGAALRRPARAVAGHHPRFAQATHRPAAATRPQSHFCGALGRLGSDQRR